ncbi:L-rhamnose mutarotase [Microbacterium lacus]|uniref:L-rhamnose mutarotase n=1 Tax=Microbacterium lacus TaxID=415217 RepID=A0ABN2FX52_9MICO
MQRVCFHLDLEPALVDEYVEAHRAVWPDMLRAIQRSGRRNYSLFLDRRSSSVIGYYETDDDVASTASLRRDPIATEWERRSLRFFRDVRTRADEASRPLPSIFHLEQQLAQTQGQE